MTTNNNNSISGVVAVQDKDNDNDRENPFEEYMWMREEDEFNKQALEQIREDDFIEQCFEEMLEEEELGMFVPPPHLLHSQQQHQQDVDAGVELMNNLNLGVQENIVQQQDIDEELSSTDHEDGSEGGNNVGGDGGSNQGNERGNQGDKAEDNSEGSSSDVDSDSSSDAPLR